MKINIKQPAKNGGFNEIKGSIFSKRRVILTEFIQKLQIANKIINKSHKLFLDL